jgi:uncharacterized membrane protein YbhN (UPF0104 family)
MGAETGNKRKIFVTSLIGILLLAFLIWYASPSKVFETLKGADFRLIVAAWVTTIIATIARTIRFAIFVHIRRMLLRTYAVFSVARLLNLALPFRTGDLAMLALLKRVGLARSIAHLLPVWLLLRTTDALALATWFCGAVALSTIGREYLPAGISIVIIAFFALFLMHYAVDLVPRKMLQKPDNWFALRFAAVAEGVRSAEGTSKRVFAILTGLLIWGLLLGSATLSQMAFSTPLDMRSALLAATLVFSFSILPIHAPPGVGTGEVMWSTAMVLVGVPLEDAVPIAIGVRMSALAILFIEAATGGFLMLVRPDGRKTPVDEADTASYIMVDERPRPGTK